MLLLTMIFLRREKITYVREQTNLSLSLSKYIINMNIQIYLYRNIYLFECLIQPHQETIRQIQKGTFFETTGLEKMMEGMF